jgi:hypothetical protein
MVTLSVELHDADLTRLGWLNDATSVAVKWRHNRRGTATVVVPLTHRRAAQLVEPGRRLRITYTADGGTPLVWSGRVATVQAQGPTGAASLVVTGLEDWFDGILAWPAPAAALTAQPDRWTATGPAETVIKTLVAANAVTRLGLPWTVPATAGRGDVVTIDARMAPLSEPVELAADQGGIGVRLVHDDTTGLTLDVYTGADRSGHVMSEASGALAAWSLTVAEPGATRTVVGLEGEAEERVFLAAADTALEAEWGLVGEVFTDARDVNSVEEPDVGPRRAAERLAEGAPTIAVAATLTESRAWRVGRNLGLGDLVRVEPIPGLFRFERVREIDLAWTAADGLRVSPIIGDPDTATPERVLAAKLAGIARGLRQLRAR